MFCVSFLDFKKEFSQGWGFGPIFLPQKSEFRIFFVSGRWGIRPFKKALEGLPEGWAGLELTDTKDSHSTQSKSVSMKIPSKRSVLLCEGMNFKFCNAMNCFL